jgi:hypothetical protein
LNHRDPKQILCKFCLFIFSLNFLLCVLCDSVVVFFDQEAPMSGCFPSMLILLLFVLSPVRGPVETDKPTGRPAEVEVRFHDGSTVRAVLQDNLEVLTPYGKLTVPIRDVRRIEFGLHLADGQGKKIDGLVSDLGGISHKNRAAASRELGVLGIKAYPALLQAARSTDLEIARRAKELLKPLQERIRAEQLRVEPDDIIHTTEFPITGRIVSRAIKARTACLGDVEVQICLVRSLHALAAGNQEARLSGTWLGNQNRPCGILQQGRCLLLVNEGGSAAIAEMTDANSLVVHTWGNLVGEIAKGGRTITWKNGAIWKRP